MENVVAILIGAAWAAIFGMLVWGSVSGWRRQLRSDESARREVLR
jgi:hypothetical protein